MHLLRNLLLALGLLAAAPAWAAWLEAESPHFLVYSDGAEDELRTQVQLLEDYHQLLRALTGASDAPPANKLRLYLVRSAAELRKVRDVGGGTMGFYLATPEGTAGFAIRRENGTGFGAQDVIFHEYAHHFMLQNFAANYPSWYIEGFAEYLATAEFTDSAIEVGRYNDNRASRLRDTWLPLDRMLTSDSVPVEGWREVARFYAQSWLMVHYLMRDPARREALQRYLRAFGAGEDPKASFRTRRAAREHESDPMAMKALIRAELLYGDPDRAETLLADLLRVVPEDRDALYLRGLAYIHAGRADTEASGKAAAFVKARPWLARAHKADGNFYPALIRYAESFSLDAGYSDENVGNILLLACQLAPQVSLIRLNAAQQQALMGDRDMAKALLAPIVNTVHSKQVREASRTLIAEVDAGKTPTTTFHIETIEKD